MKKQVFNSQDGHVVGYIPEGEGSYNRRYRQQVASKYHKQEKKSQPAFGLDWLF